MPAVYDKLGIRFLYPDNWSLDESDALAGQNSVSAYSPDGAFWSVSLYPGNPDREELANAALEALQLEYPGAEAEAASEEIEGREVTGFDLNFLFLDLTSTALIRVFDSPGGTCVILCQAEDRDYVEVEAVFRAMTASLIRLSG
jgi:hypothetical protein